MGPTHPCLGGYSLRSALMLTPKRLGCLDYSYLGLFVPQTIRTMGGLFVPWMIRTMEYSYVGLFVRWTFRTTDYSYYGLFVPFTNITYANKVNVYVRVCLSHCQHCVHVLK